LPALWAAYQAFLDEDVKGDLMPALVAAWRTDVMSAYKPLVQADYRRMTEHIAEGLAEFHVADVEPEDVTTFLKPWARKHRMFNRYRSLIRELMRYAIEKGYRKAGTNPVDGIIKTKTAPMATSNSPTCGQSTSPRQDGRHYESFDVLTASRAAASLSL
jgi:hypothetical protein